MAQLVVAAAGAALGGFIAPGIVAFGMTGASLGWMAGSMLGSAFAPTQKSSGPQLSDLSVSTSAYGTPIPYVQGHPRISGQIVWASTKREIATTTEQGKGGGGAEYTSYTYEVDLLILLTDNEIAGVARIWSNGELVYNKTTGSSVGTLAASDNPELWQRLTIYSGASGQLPDPTYEAAVGTANAPAYRGRGSLFIQGLQLGGSGQIPNLTFEVATSTTPSITLTQTSVQAQAGAIDVAYRSGYIYVLGQSSQVFSAYSIAKPASPELTGSATTSISFAKAFALNGTLAYVVGTGVSSVCTVSIANPASPVVIGTSSISNLAPCLCVVGDLVCVGQNDAKLRLYNPASVTAFTLVSTVSLAGTPRKLFAVGSMVYVILSDASAVYIIDFSTPAAPAIRSTTLITDLSRSIFVASGIAYINTANGFLTAYDVSDPTSPALLGSVATSGNGTGMVVAGSLAYLSQSSSNRVHVVDVSNPAAMVLKATLLDSGYSDLGLAYVAGYIYTAASTSVRSIAVAISIGLNNPAVSDTVRNLCSKAGLSESQYDTTALTTITKPVRSMAISSVSSARTVLDMFAQSYHFEAVLSDKIYFRPRASAPAATLTFDEIGVIVDSGTSPEPLPLTQANELEIPAQMALTYSNVDGDYQTDTQYSDRLLTGQESTSAMQVPLGFTSSEAKQIVDAMLLDKAVSALTTSVSLGVTRAALEPTDVVLLTGEDGSTYRMRIVKKAEVSGVTTLECVQDDSTVFTQTGTTAGGTASQTVVLATPTTTLELLDVPLLRDVDNLPGHYVAVKGSAANWTSAGLYDSLDDLTYTPNTTISSQAIMGTCTTALADWAGGNVFDDVSSVTVNVGAQQLASVTRDDILASQSTNAALIGSEVVQYRTATLVSAGVYTLSGFLRGQRGTASTGHAASERFIVLASGGLRFVPLQQGDLGRLRYYKAASAGQKLSAVTSQSLTPAGITLKPFAPVDARANRDTADTVLTWIRQTRLSTRIVGTLGISSPLGEAAEAYEVEIYTAGHAALLRTLTSATPSVTYTSAQQVTDFGAGQSTIAVKIYQISATVGRGTPLTTTV